MNLSRMLALVVALVGLVSMGACGSSTTAIPAAAARTTITDPIASGKAADAERALYAYVNAAERDDCKTAEHYVVRPQPGQSSVPGNLCALYTGHVFMRFDGWSLSGAPTHPSANVYEFGVQLHVTHVDATVCAGSVCGPGQHTWFLEFRETPKGFMLTNGGTGP